MTTTVGSLNDTLAQSLERVVGSAHIVKSPDLEIDGLKPRVLARPASNEEVAACLAVCNEMHAAVVPAGNMTWLGGGNPLTRADVIVSLDRMNKVLDYSAPDLTATLQAGASVRDFSALAVAENQWLPLDPPGLESASIGALVACASSGPLRFGFGTPRDYVIGLRLAHPDGKQSKSGGKVVKNVAGYDLNKLYTGSFGTLAAITEVTVKLRPAPERMTTVALSGNDSNPAFALMSRILGSRLRPVSLAVLNARMAKSAELGLIQTCLVRFAGSEAEVAHQVGVVTEMAGAISHAVLNDAQSQQVWRSIADMDRQRTFAMRISVLTSHVQEVYATSDGVEGSRVVADAGAGVVRIAFDAEETDSIARLSVLRSSAERLGGTAFIERAPFAVRRKIDAWNDPGPTGNLMRTIKRQFDPQSVLNPGKFVGGI